MSAAACCVRRERRSVDILCLFFRPSSYILARQQLLSTHSLFSFSSFIQHISIREMQQEQQNVLMLKMMMWRCVVGGGVLKKSKMYFCFFFFVSSYSALVSFTCLLFFFFFDWCCLYAKDCLLNSSDFFVFITNLVSRTSMQLNGFPLSKIFSCFASFP